MPFTVLDNKTIKLLFLLSLKSRKRIVPRYFFINADIINIQVDTSYKKSMYSYPTKSATPSYPRIGLSFSKMEIRNIKSV